MKTTIIVLSILSGLMMSFTLICGLWMHAQDQVEASSVNFHVSIALLTVALTAATLVLAVRKIA